MAKKGGVQQLQTEINTNEELTKFLDRDGLIVLDVFTEWCGPCLAMIGSLKKIKLEQGGDDLHLAIVKCDKIDVFERFRNKSEPTWLLLSKGKLVNSAFGANVPHLIELILKELDIERRTRDSDSQTSVRLYYELNEMTPVERERFEMLQKIEEENERIEQVSEQRRRFEYIKFVTDTIMKNSSDMGVTILMPHVISRDLLKRLSDSADKCQLVAKDKKTMTALREHFDILEICASADSLPLYLVDHIVNRDIFIICWKVTDTNIDINEKSVEDYLSSFVHLVWNEEETTNGNSSILKALSVVIETEINDEDIMSEDDDDDDNIEQEKLIEETMQGVDGEKEMDESGNQDGKKKNGEVEMHQSEITKEITATEKRENGQKNHNEENPSGNITITSSLKVKHRAEIKIPPIWTPVDKRTNAALIYLFFRSMTETYLPPDPPVERPHLTIIFHAYKHREIMEIIEQYRDDVLAYGYFTTDNCETAQLIANSTFNYNKNPPTIHDKLVLKVAKTRNSPVLLALKKLGPSYISKNTEIGKNECMIFFPTGYKNSSETGETTPIPVDEKPKKKKKKRKSEQGLDEESDNQVQNVAQTPTDVEETDEPEDGTEKDDDESVEDEDSAEANDTENVPEK